MKKVHKCAFIRNGNYATASRLLTAFFEKIGRDPVFRNERKIPVFANTPSASCKVACAAAKISTGWGINRDVTHHVTINLRKSQVTTFFARRKSCDQGCQPEVRAHLSRDVTRVRNYVQKHNKILCTSRRSRNRLHKAKSPRRWLFYWFPMLKNSVIEVTRESDRGSSHMSTRRAGSTKPAPDSASANRRNIRAWRTGRACCRLYPA